MYHPKANEKIGNGIQEIWIERNPALHSGNRFIIKRLDNSACDFSYKYCLGKALPTHYHRVREAMRNAIRPYIMSYRDRYFLKNQNAQGRCPCAISGKGILPCDSDVDHTTPITFYYLAQKFMQVYKIQYIHIDVFCINPRAAIEILDKDIKKKWIVFHNKECKLRIVDKFVHRTIAL